jgi:hypothetical protein
MSFSIRPAPNIVEGIIPTTISGEKLVHDGDTPYPKISNLLAGAGVTLSSDSNDSITISSTGTGGIASVDNAPTAGSTNELVDNTDPTNPKIRQITGGAGITITNNPADPGPGVASYVIAASPPTITMVDLSTFVDVNVPPRGLTGSTFSTTGGILNFCSIIEHDTYVELSGSVNLQKTSGDVTGTLPAGHSYFDMRITYPFPPARIYPVGAGAALVGGSVSHFANSNWTTGARLVTPSTTMSLLEIRIGTTSAPGAALPNTITDLDIRFSLMYAKP